MSARLAPVVNDLSRPFWDAAEEGRLSLPHCVATGRPFWPPAPASPLRNGGAVAWREIEAAGMLLSMAVYPRAFQAPPAGQLPDGLAVIEGLPADRLIYRKSGGGGNGWVERVENM